MSEETTSGRTWRIADLIEDGAGLGGAGLMVYGAWEINHPAALIVLGALLLSAAVHSAKRKVDL